MTKNQFPLYLRIGWFLDRCNRKYRHRGRGAVAIRRESSRHWGVHHLRRAYGDRGGMWEASLGRYVLVVNNKHSRPSI